MSFKVGNKVRLVKGTLFVGKGGVGTVEEPLKGQTPPQLFPWRVSYPVGQDTRTVWCGTDEIELVSDAGPETDNQVADGSRDYGPTSGPEDGDTVDTTQTGPPEGCIPGCPSLIPCSIDYANNPDLDGYLAERYGDEQEPWADDWEWEHDLDEFAQAVSTVFLNAEALLIQKHADYGPKNISQSPGGPLNGLRVRMHDKLARINNLVDTGAEPTNESLKDSFTDLLNYSAIAIMVLEGTWPNE